METREVNGIFYDAGKWPLEPDMPTVIFIHGSANSRRLWKEQLTVISEIVNTLAIDLPGHGKSSGTGMESISDYAGAVMDFINSMEIRKPVPCGLSLGGAITLELLIKEKLRMHAGILINTGSKLRVAPAILDAIEKDYNGFVGSFDKFGISKKSDPGCLKELIEDASAIKMETALGDFRACDKFDIMKDLPDIKVPVLVLTAEDDVLTPPKYGVFMEENIMNASRVHIKDAAHLSPLEQPGPVNRAIIDFLRQQVTL
jgi:pimeloyl-ACP methyl ester carboxylesterase